MLMKAVYGFVDYIYLTGNTSVVQVIGLNVLTGLLILLIPVAIFCHVRFTPISNNNIVELFSNISECRSFVQKEVETDDQIPKLNPFERELGGDWVSSTL